MEKLLSVMIVDDERFVIEELCTMINWEACGFQVIATAFNGRQGLKKFRELHPSLILADIRMPFMDGIEMIRQIREEDDTVNIVLLTAYEDFRSDDERFVIEELCTMITWEACGFQVIATAFNGRQGLKKFRELHPSLILADIRMPFMDGIEMIRQIREEDDTVNIVLLTAYEDF